jgi:deoxyribose-phosphate aldolase
MVFNFAHFVQNQFGKISETMKHFSRFIHNDSGRFNIIIEEGMFSDEQKILASKLGIEAGADGIRTCSGAMEICGMSTGRATIHDICLLRENLGQKITIKAGGGTDFMYLEDALEYINCGANSVDIGQNAVIQLEEIGYQL